MLLQCVSDCMYGIQVLADIASLEDILEGLAPYIERHIAHADRLLISSSVLDYTLQRMQHVQLDSPQ